MPRPRQRILKIQGDEACEALLYLSDRWGLSATEAILKILRKEALRFTENDPVGRAEICRLLG